MKYLKLSIVILMLTAGNALAQATRTTEVNEFPFDIVEGNPCTGEPVHLTGTFDEVLVELSNPAGGLHFSHFLIVRQLTGLGLSTGTIYRIQSLTSTTGNVRDLHGTLSSRSEFRVVALGSGLVFTAVALFHTTVNADGVLTASVDSFSAVCR